MRIGVTELLLVLVVALLVLGPDKLPRYARKLGEALAEIRKASDDVTREIRENVVEPLEEAQRPLREAVEPVEELDRTVRENLRDVKNSFEGIGKESPRKTSAPEPVVSPAAVTPEPAAPENAANATPEAVVSPAASVAPEPAVNTVPDTVPETVAASATESPAPEMNL